MRHMLLWTKRIDVSRLLKSRTRPIGVDVADDGLKLAQLAKSPEGISLIAGGRENQPENVKPGTADWQRWAVEAIRETTTNSRFRGKEVIAAVPASEVFVEHIRMPKTKEGNLKDVIFSKIKQQLPFEPIKKNTMMKYTPTDQDYILVMATQRKIIDRHLAIYEKAGLKIKSIGVWPMALTNCYAKFFSRRTADLEAIVMLLDIQTNCTNLVVCRHSNLLFASSIPIGAKLLNDERMVTRLVLELTACRRHLASIHRNARIERLIFLSGRAVDAEIYTTIAKQLGIQAQMGDCLAAVEMADPCRWEIDRRDGNVNWATAFGLSLS